MYKMWKVATPTPWDLESMDKWPGLDHVPLIAGYRDRQRRRILHNLVSKKPGDSWWGAEANEDLGMLTSAAIPGAMAYNPAKKLLQRLSKGKFKGGKFGLIASLLAAGSAHYGGKLLGSSLPSRTMQQHYNAVNRKHKNWYNYLLPGYASFQRTQSRAFADSLKGLSAEEIIRRSRALDRGATGK